MKFHISVWNCGMRWPTRYHQASVEFGTSQRSHSFGPRFQTYQEAADYLRSVKPRRDKQ